MSKSIKNTKTANQKQPESIQSFVQFLLDGIICIYMLLIIVVLPFYNEDGYTHIGTDKATFFRKCIVYVAMCLLPVLLLQLVLPIIRYCKEHRRDWRELLGIKRLAAYGKEHFSITDWFALAYGGSVILSYLFSSYREAALWGADGWFMGCIPQLALVVAYFLVSKVWTRRRWMVLLLLPVSGAVFVLGLLNRFGVYPFDMKVDNAQFISTIGNINWYCGYLVSVFFAGFFLFWQVEWEKGWQKLLITAYVVIGFATLVTHGSSSGVLTMAVMLLVFFWMSVSDGRRMERFWQEMIVFSLVCLGIYLLRKAGVLAITYIEATTELLTNSVLAVLMTVVSVGMYLWVWISNRRKGYPQKAFWWLSRLVCGGMLAALGGLVLVIIINTASGGAISNVAGVPGKSLLTFSPTWGSNRGATWTAGVMCFLEQNFLHKLVGAGPDCMAEFLYKQGSGQLLNIVRGCFGDLRLTNAHNEWLTILVNMGLVGLVSFVGMMVTAIRRFLQTRNHNMIAGAMGFCLLAYTVNNMFSFQQSMSVSTIFILLAVGENYMRLEKKQK